MTICPHRDVVPTPRVPTPTPAVMQNVAGVVPQGAVWEVSDCEPPSWHRSHHMPYQLGASLQQARPASRSSARHSSEGGRGEGAYLEGDELSLVAAERGPHRGRE